MYGLENESDLSFDLYYIYFLVWGKLFMFIAVILEEILRVLLALYVCYLITFDVHAVNNSYNEEKTFNKKNNLETTTTYFN
jgi:hypothetical protein